MAIVSLAVRGFRVLDEIQLEFDPGANYLFGPNGSGKTSVLEAVYYAATGRSFRTQHDGELLRFGADVLSVAAEDEQGRTGRLAFDGRQKRFELEGRRFARLSEFFGWLPVVPLLLGDVELVSGPPSRRREYLDMAGAKADRSHIGCLNDYRRALAQYNRLLAARVPGAELDAWEAAVAQAAVALARRRSEVAETLLGRATELAVVLVGRPVEFRFCGWSVAAERGVASGPGFTAAELCGRLAATRERALEFGRAVVGPHRDDVAVQIDGRDVRRFGSVGEQRAAATALRLAEAGFLREVTGRPAVCLMDEIASELDAERSAALFERAGEAGQVLYAAARPFAVRGRIFQLDNGRTRKIQTAG
jgi:DNA replication and repair protein RecF